MVWSDDKVSFENSVISTFNKFNNFQFEIIQAKEYHTEIIRIIRDCAILLDFSAISVLFWKDQENNTQKNVAH